MGKGPFVSKIALTLSEKLKRGLEERGFVLSQPQYTIFTGKKKGVSCTLYESGKLVVQGKEKDEFIEFYLEPEILKDFSYTNPMAHIDLVQRIGVDESGKGDFFGPLCVAAVCAGGEQIEQLMELGVKDSKTLTDQRALELGEKIKKVCPYHIVKINPKKYNEVYPKFGNLNTLLAWGHATVIEKLVIQTGCQKAIIDQFAAERVVEAAIAKKGIEVDLTQRTKAESDPVVAAASILARMAFIQGLKMLSDEVGVELPKGASPKVTEVGKLLVRQQGKQVLEIVGKLHFKTIKSIEG